MRQKKDKAAIVSFPEIAQAALVAKGDRHEQLAHVQQYLERFGYLSEGDFQPTVLDDATSRALRNYQRFYRLAPSGEFDEATRSHMAESRCGLPDIVDGLAFSTLCAWPRMNISYAFNNGTADIGGNAELQAVRDAFQTWATAAAFSFTEVPLNQNHDVEIDWRNANDPDHSMVGGVIAHSDFPPGCSVIANALPLPLHFDDSEHVWSIGAVANAFDVESVALHEIGHILGLQHSNVAGSIMAPSISSNTVRRVLGQDDRDGIRSLYGRMFWALIGNTAGFGHGINDGRPFWIGNFSRLDRTEVLFYYPGDDNWWLGTYDGVQLNWSLAGNTAGFGHAINDGRPFWIGDFTGNGRSDVLFYYPGDDNWWLATHGGPGGQLNWSFAGNTGGFGHGINDGRPFWIGRFSRPDRAEVLFYYPGDDNWWLGTHDGTQLVWTFVGNTAGFGHGINDGRPFWIGDFNGDGRDDVLFYYPGDDNWWLGSVSGPGGQLNWSFAGNTAGFGHGINDGRPFWTGNFSRSDRVEVLFYYPGDDNWWLGTHNGYQLVWSLAGNTAGFGHGINDGRPFFIGNFTRADRAEVLFYYPGDDNWWLGSHDGSQLQWSLAGNTAGFGHGINDGRPFWIGDFIGDGRANVLFYYPGDDNWWLASLR